MAARVETLAVASPKAGPASGHRATVVRRSRPASAPVLVDLGSSAMPDVSAAPGDVAPPPRHDDGFAAGFAEGIRAGRAAAELEAADALAEITQLRTTARRLVQALGDGVAAADANAATAATAAGQVTVDVVLSLVEAVVGREVERGGSRDALARAAAVLPTGARGTARVHPEDLSLLDGAVHPGLEIVGDPSVQRGGCIVDLPDATIDAQMGAALERVRAALLGDDEVAW